MWGKAWGTSHIYSMEQKFTPNKWNITVMIFDTKFIAKKEQDASKKGTTIKDTRNKITPSVPVYRSCAYP
jgi:hypothetical protein